MYRSFVCLFLSFALLVPTHVVATNCTNVFDGNLNQFQLVEKHYKDSTTPTVLQVTAVNATTTDQDPYLAPGCVDQSVYFNLNRGILIVDFSSEMKSAKAAELFVSRTCDGTLLFKVNREPKIWTLPSGAQVNTSVRVFADKNETKLLAYVQVGDESTNRMLLSGPDRSVVAIATRSDFNNQSTWTVNNTSGTEQSATIISYLLTLKRNTDYACPPVPYSAAQIFVGVAIGVSAVTAAVVGFICYLKQKPRREQEKLLEQL